MLINDEIQKQLLQLFAKSSNIPKVEAEQQSAAQLQLAPGQQVQAEIMAKLPNHLYLARIAGEMFKMELPLNVQPGETMQMTFVGADPRITFELQKPETGFLPVNISTTGKWLSSLMAEPGNREVHNLQSFRTTTKLDGLPGDTEHLAEQLRDAFSQGGLFYESHLAEWAIGERSLKQLFMEPQGKLSRRLKNGIHVEQSQVDGKQPILDQVAEETTTTTSSSGVVADPNTFPIIRDQLAILNSGLVSWSGQVWPEQMADISIQEDEAGSASVDEREWQSSVRLHLPKLGLIDATLRLSGTGLAVVLKAEEGRTAAILNEELPALKERLDQAGIRLTDSVVDHEQGRQ